MKDNAGQFQNKITKNTGEYREPVQIPIKNKSNFNWYDTLFSAKTVKVT